MPEGKANNAKSVWEEIEVSGSELVERVKELAAAGNVRKLKIIADDGDVFFEAPLNIGLAVSGVVVLADPWLAVLGVIAGLVKKVKIEVERQSEDDVDHSAEADAPNEFENMPV